MINEAANGKIEVTDLRLSNRNEVVRIKDTPADKSYTIRFKLDYLNENEYKILTAPMDLTKQNRKRSSNNRRTRGDIRNDNTTPLPNEILTEEVHIPSEKDLIKLKKTELVELCADLAIKKTGTKAELVERILASQSPGTTPFDLPEDEKIRSTIVALKGTKLAQRTPDRVAHRRADLIRRREINQVQEPLIEIMSDGSKEVEFTLRCESGTYVKETVHGDNGRTQPSVASLLKAKCEVQWLDVSDIHAD